MISLLGTMGIKIENTGGYTRRNLGMLVQAQEISPETTAREAWWVRASSDDLLDSLQFSIAVRAALGEMRFGISALHPDEWVSVTNWFAARPEVVVEVDEYAAESDIW